MPNIIDSIQISSSTFDVRDKSATTVVNLTQDEYDNLPSSAKTANVLYNITDATAGDLSQYWTSAQTQSAITEATSGKADTIYVDQSVSGKVDTTTFNTYSGNVETALSGKQDTLIAGENITISGNVISAEGGSITIDPSLDSGSTNPVANSAITTALNAKSDKGNFNNFILTSKNGNPGAMFKNDNGGSKILWLSKINGTKVFEISALSQAANFSLVETSAITTSVTSASTDAQVPSAKAVYDAIQEGGGIDSGTVQTMIDESISGKTNQSDFVSHSGNTSIHVTTAQTAAWDAKSDFSGSYNDLSNKPTIPSKTSDLTNDSDFATTGDVQTATADMATKTWVGNQGYLTEHQSLSNYYTKSETSGATEISTALASKADKSEIPSLDGYATETWVEGKGYLTEHQDISGKLDVSAFNTYSGSVDTTINSKASQASVDSLNGIVTAHTANATIHVTAQDKTNWNNKSDFSGSYNDLTDKPTIPTVPTSNTAFTNDAGYITSDDITGKTNQTDFVSHSGNTTMHVTTSEKNTWNNKSDFSGSYNDLTDKPTIPTSASQLTNDSGYITSGDAQTQIDSSISGKADTTAVTQDIAAAVSGKLDASTFEAYSGNVETALSGKQDTLSAGTNITIVDNVISAEGGGSTYTAGRGIDITNSAISISLPISAGTGSNSIIEGHTGNTASGPYSHAEGGNTSATTNYAHAEGTSTKASGAYSHAEGASTSANGYYSHSEGYYAKAIGKSSHAEGQSTIANNQSEHASGQYNVSSTASTTFGDSGNTLFSIGNGTSTSARHNALEVRQNGDIYISSGGTDILLQDHLGGGSSYTAGDGIDITNDVISVTGKVDESAFTAHTADTTIHVTAQDKTNWNNKSNFSGDYNDLTNKPTIPTVPTNVSDFTNDAGYITSNDISGKTNQSDFTAHTANTTVHVTSAEKTTWNAKSDFSGDYNDLTNKLSAGTNITIVDNVISAEGGSITIDPSLDSGSTNAVANSAITTAINDRATKNQAVGFYQFGETSGKPYITFKMVNSALSLNSIYYSKINGKGILTNNGTWAGNNLMFSLVETSAITTSITSSSTDAQVPSAKAVNDKLGGLSLVKLTQAEYDALATKDNSTLYVIVN